ncbi:hypothetical protein [Halorubrum salsamenti]|uniref:hypothetical protein n=1 Tax=Halorubrum salsamenti TaxID=2583990 RepID=UPI00119F58B2|nr:hypothetical protein [Halorubrum salsamenti]
MTTLDSYLAAVYDAAAEAETLALINGQRRLRRMVESGRLPEDASVPVYHAADLSVTLDVGLEARETEGGTELVVTESESNDDTAIDIDLEVYDMLEAGSLPQSGAGPRGPDTVDVHFPIPDASDEDGGSDGGHAPRTSSPTRGSDEREREDEAEREEREREREERENEDGGPEGRGSDRRGDADGGAPSARRSAGSGGILPFDLDAVTESDLVDPTEDDPDDRGGTRDDGTDTNDDAETDRNDD